MDKLDYETPLFQTPSQIRVFALETKELRRQGLDFKNLVRKNKLTGLIFRKVWESDEIP